MDVKRRRIIRKLRHWKQRFDPNAAFICRRPMEWAEKQYDVGDEIPEGLRENRTKLRLFWEAHRIELAEFEMPDVTTGQVLEQPEGIDDWLDSPKDGGVANNWLD